MAHPSTQSPTRRTVVFSLAGTAASACLLSASESKKPLSGASPRNYFAATAPMASASVGQWQAEVGSLFFASTEAGAVALRLASVTALPIVGVRPPGLRPQPFEAHFELEGHNSVPLADRLYAVRHPAHGSFKLFFSSAGTAMKAMFN